MGSFDVLLDIFRNDLMPSVRFKTVVLLIKWNRGSVSPAMRKRESVNVRGIVRVRYKLGVKIWVRLTFRF